MGGVCCLYYLNCGCFGSFVGEFVLDCAYGAEWLTLRCWRSDVVEFV